MASCWRCSAGNGGKQQSAAEAIGPEAVAEVVESLPEDILAGDAGEAERDV